jgi:hypothetical protein
MLFRLLVKPLFDGFQAFADLYEGVVFNGDYVHGFGV